VTLGRAVARTVTSMRASPENPAVPLTSPALLEMLGGAPSDAGVHVSERTALHMPAVWRAVFLISFVCASLPLRVYQDELTRKRVKNNLLRDPHPEMTPSEVWRHSYGSRCLWGNSYAQKVRNRAGQVVELWPITPDRVMVGKVRSTPELPTGKLFSVVDDWGAVHAMTSREILHIPGFGYDGVTGVSPIRMAAQAIGLSLAAEKAGAKFFGQGAMLSGILQTEQRLDPDQAALLKEQWRAKVSGVNNAYDVAILDSGAKFQSLTMPYKDAQFLESRVFEIFEIARMFGVPPFLLMETSKSTSWGTGLEQQALGFVQFDLAPGWLTPTEERITKELLFGEQYSEYAVEGLLRGDSQARAEFYKAMREVGAYSANDIRHKENEPPVEGGDTYLQPLNMAPLGSTPKQGGASTKASVVDEDEEDGDDDPDDD
jgi:HK97 family phage portal protein